MDYGWETSDYTRNFVAKAPARVMVAFLNGLDAESLTGAVVEAQSGEATGLAGRVRPGNVGKSHTMIMAYQRVNGPPDSTLSQIIDAGRQDTD
jgi:hypothetical protein